MKRASLYLTLGLLLLSVTFFGILITIVVAADPAAFPQGGFALAFFSVCTIGFAIPTLLFLFLWRKETKRLNQLEAVGAILRGYRELSIANLAVQIGQPPALAENLAAASVAAGFAQGYIDHASGMFYSGAVYQSTPQVVVVPPPVAASPPPTQVFREREVIREIVKIPCRYCGALVLQTAQRCQNCNAPLA